MSTQRITVRFWGVRGSLAGGGPGLARFGGHTSCVEIRVGDELIILDAGTGLHDLGRSISQPTRTTLLISHFHWDHIQGFPFFGPLYEEGNRLVIYGPGEGAVGVEAALRRQMQPPHFPVPLGELQADLVFRSIRPGDEIEVGPARIQSIALNHPDGCLGYRVCVDNVCVVFATDTEQPASGGLDPSLVSFARNADLLICDAQYTDDEYHGHSGPARKGWGHSTFTEACRIAAAAGAHQLALFHHDPVHDDDFIDKLVAESRSLFANVFAAREGMTLELGASIAPIARDLEADRDLRNQLPLRDTGTAG